MQGLGVPARLRIWGYPRLVPSTLYLTQDPVSMSQKGSPATALLDGGGGQAGRGSGDLPGSFSASRDRVPPPSAGK